MNRFPLRRSIAAASLLIVVLIALGSPLGNAARQDGTRLPSTCDPAATGDMVGRDGDHMGSPRPGMGRDGDHMDGLADGPGCDGHMGTPSSGTSCRDTGMMGTPFAGMGRDNMMGTPGNGMDQSGMMGSPVAGMGPDGDHMGFPLAGAPCDGRPMGTPAS